MEPDRSPVHPGEVLKQEFLDELNLTPYALAKRIGVLPMRINQIVNRKRTITVDTAMRLSRYFGTTAKFWLNLQNSYDVELAQRTDSDKYSSIKPMEEAAA